MAGVGATLSRHIAIGALLFVQAAAAASYGPYEATVVRVIDGDSLEVDVRLWPGLTQRVSIRIEGIDTPEKNGPACERVLAEAAAKFTRNWVSVGPEVVVSDVSLDKYGGRVVGTVRRYGGLNSLGTALVAAGHAREYDGGKRGKWCN
jgi:micrococcal nuclease